LQHRGVHRIPRQQIVTTAKRPSIGHGTARGYKDDLPDGQSEIFFRKGVDSRLSVDLVREIRFLAQRFAGLIIVHPVIPGREQSERARNPLIQGLGGNLWVEIDPSRIAFLDQPDFPVSPPFFHLLLADNRRHGIIIDFEPDQFVDRISLGETGDRLAFVLVDATNNVICHAEI
jgi:hypothetical protein